MRKRALAAAATLLALVAARDDPLAGRVAGAPARCIDLDRVDGPGIQDDGTILYRQNGRRVWRASVIGACPRLRPFDTLIVEVYGRRLCADDRFRIRGSGTSIASGYCRLGADHAAALPLFDRAAAVRR